MSEEDQPVVIVNDYDGNPQKLSDCVELSDGRFAHCDDEGICYTNDGLWMVKDDCEYVESKWYDRDSSEIILTHNDEWILESNSVMMHDGDVYHEDDENIVLDYTGEHIYSESALFGYVTSSNQGWFSTNDNDDYITTDYDNFRTINIANSRGWYFCDCCDEYTGGCDHDNDDDDDERRDSYQPGIAGYHHAPRQWLCGAHEIWRCGIEIECEDEEMAADIDNEEWKHAGYHVEQDGSLDDNSGFEFITPVLPLMNREIIKRELQRMRPILQARKTSNCGGHIHISNKNMSPKELFTSIANYMPLLYALYPKRIKDGGSYACAKSKHNLLRDDTKHQAAYLNKDFQTVELRIFPSPRSVFSLDWRLELIRIMIEHPEPSYEELINMCFRNNSLAMHLRKVYKDDAIFMGKVDLIKENIHTFERYNVLESDLIIPDKFKKYINKFNAELYDNATRTDEGDERIGNE